MLTTHQRCFLLLLKKKRLHSGSVSKNITDHIAVKKRRLECERRKETNVSCAGAMCLCGWSQLHAMEITGETETKELSTKIVAHSGNENDEISDGPLVIQGKEQITGLLAKKEAKSEELERVVLEFEGK